ncbi:hypothetical protein [Chloroflexus sp.]|uniref:hypothetical protein n=1 Tax=Chloroflexus sp. TaxID=1904827 RepID=UPI0040498B0E
MSHFEAKKPLLRNYRLPKVLPDFLETIFAMPSKDITDYVHENSRHERQEPPQRLPAAK